MYQTDTEVLILKNKVQCLTAQNKQPNRKLGRRPKWTFFQRRHTNGHEAHEKTFTIANY